MEKDFSASGQISNQQKIEKYLLETFQPEDPVLAEISERSLSRGLPEIQVGRFDSLHLEILTRACHAKNAIEIGTLCAV